MKVLLASKNKAKLQGANQALNKFYQDVEIIGYSVDSLVPEQPINQDTMLGAENRIDNLKEINKLQKLNADMFLAIETGMINLYGKWFITNIAIIEDVVGNKAYGTSASFPVPQTLVEQISQNTLAVVADNLFNKVNLKNNLGAIDLLTHHEINRIDLTEQAFVMALTQLINGDIWKN